MIPVYSFNDDIFTKRGKDFLEKEIVNNLMKCLNYFRISELFAHYSISVVEWGASPLKTNAPIPEYDDYRYQSYYDRFVWESGDFIPERGLIY